MSQVNVAARAYHRILELARTIADLAECEDIQSVHLTALNVCFANVLQYHPTLGMESNRD